MGSQSFTARLARGEPERYLKDVPNGEVHVFDAGHFALHTAADEIGGLVRNFVGTPALAGRGGA